MANQLVTLPEFEELVPDNPYKGLVPYTEEDAPFFFGREAEQETIIANLRAWRLTLLYGPSGVGKSSVLGAGVIHQLREQARQNLAEHGLPEFAVIMYNAWREEKPVEGLLKEVQQAVLQAWQIEGATSGEAYKPGESLGEALQTWTTRLEGKLLIILDQFEEYFLYHEEDEVEKDDGNFAAEFARTVNRPDLPVNFLISIREDRLATLDCFKTSLPGLFDNYLRLEHLNRSSAKAAIEEPLAEYNRRQKRKAEGRRQKLEGEQNTNWQLTAQNGNSSDTSDFVMIEPELVTAVLAQTRTGQVLLGNTGQGALEKWRERNQSNRDGRIEAPFLQLVMTRLWNTEIEKASQSNSVSVTPVLRLSTLLELGGAEQIVRSHLDKVMSGLTTDEQEAAARVFNQLVTPSGTKIAHNVPDLARYTDLPETRLTPLMEKLSGSSIRILRPVDPLANRPETLRYEIFHDVLAAAILDWRQRYLTQKVLEAEKRAVRKRTRLLRLAFGTIGVLALAVVGLVIFLIFVTPYLTAPPPAAICGPLSTLSARLVSNGTTTNILVNNGIISRKVASENAEILPGLFDSLVSVSPDGKRLVYVTALNEAMDDAKIWLVNQQGQSQSLVGIPSGFWPTAPIWSNDGYSIGYVVQNDNQLELWTVNTGNISKPTRLAVPRQLVPALFYGDSGRVMCWSTDNKKIIIRGSSGTGGVTAQTEVNVVDGKVNEVASAVTGLLTPVNLTGAKISQSQTPGGVAPVNSISGCVLNGVYSQNDPRWKNTALKSGNKLGQVGCPLVAASMLLNYYGLATVPSELANCLSGTTAGSLNSIWSDVSSKCSINRLQGGQRTAFSWDSLNNLLKTGPAIIGLLGGQTGTHFVVVTGGQDSFADNYRVADPWDGSSYKTLGYFLNRGYQLGWVVDLEGQGQDCTLTNSSAATQAPFHISGIEDGGLYHNPKQFAISVNNGISLTTTLSLARPDAPGIGVPQIQSSSLPNEISVVEEGVYTLSLEAVDQKGSRLERNLRFVLDRTGPKIELRNTSTIFEPNPTSSGPSIARHSVPLAFNASDDLSQVALIEYQVNDSSGWQVYDNSNYGTIDFVKPGTYTVKYRATDGAGNVSQTSEISFEISQDVTAEFTETANPEPTPTLAVVASPTPRGQENPLLSTATRRPVVIAPPTATPQPTLPTKELPPSTAIAQTAPPGQNPSTTPPSNPTK